MFAILKQVFAWRLHYFNQLDPALYLTYFILIWILTLTDFMSEDDPAAS